MFEKEAKEYAKANYEFLDNPSAVADIWQDGAEFVYNKINQWHDLRKDPDDLPKIDERFDTKVSVPVFSSNSKFVVYYFETKEWYCNGQKEKVIAWIELPPKFKE